MSATLEKVSKVLSQTLPVISQLRKVSEDQISALKEDMMMFTRSFCQCAEMASQYLSETLQSAASSLALKHKQLSQLTASMASKQITSEILQQLESLAWELQQTTKTAESQTKYYRPSNQLNQYLSELHVEIIFLNSTNPVYIGDLMFRKFKKLVSTVGGATGSPESMSLQDLEELREKIESPHKFY